MVKLTTASMQVTLKPFSFPEAALLLVSTKNLLQLLLQA